MGDTEINDPDPDPVLSLSARRNIAIGTCKKRLGATRPVARGYSARSDFFCEEHTYLLSRICLFGRRTLYQKTKIDKDYHGCVLGLRETLSTPTLSRNVIREKPRTVNVYLGGWGAVVAEKSIFLECTGSFPKLWMENLTIKRGGAPTIYGRMATAIARRYSCLRGLGGEVHTGARPSSR